MLAYDAMSVNVKDIPGDAEIVMGYVTGTADILWDAADFNLFRNAGKEYIAQGYGTPWRAPTIVDVESGAYTVNDIPGLVKQYPGVKVYCNQSTLPAVAGVFAGEIMLAAPSVATDDVPALVASLKTEFPKLDIVYVQNYWGPTYDASIVIDPDPDPPAPPPVEHVDIQGWELEKPDATTVPVVVGWYGNEGITYRQSNLPVTLWDQIPWSK